MTDLKHLAIIMDGNGRWAQARGHSRFFGHVRGARVARKIIEAAVERNIPYLTLYTFSSENWARPATEVTFLMKLLRRHLVKELKTLMKNNIRFRVIGNLQKLPEEARKIVQDTIDATRDNDGMTLVFALSYGSRQEIRNAIQKIARQVQGGHLDVADIDENLISACLESAFMPDPDLVIRTSGESRLSNFLLWQVAYSELFVTKTLWPDFTVTELDEALTIFSGRERRFGRIPEGLDVTIT
jgi:undecaprenyl diphosphate synthase